MIILNKLLTHFLCYIYNVKDAKAVNTVSNNSNLSASATKHLFSLVIKRTLFKNFMELAQNEKTINVWWYWKAFVPFQLFSFQFRNCCYWRSLKRTWSKPKTTLLDAQNCVFAKKHLKKHGYDPVQPHRRAPSTFLWFSSLSFHVRFTAFFKTV